MLSRPSRSRTHSASSSPSPRESEPPDTATAMDGDRSNGPSGVINSAISISVIDAAPDQAPQLRRGSGAAVVLLGAGRAVLHVGRRLGIALLQLAQGDAGIFLLALLAQRHGELQQIVRRLLAVGIFLIALGKCDCRILE